MRRLSSALAGLVLLLLPGCDRSADPQQFAPDAYALVLEDFLGEADLEAFCIAPWVGHSQDRHSTEVLRALQDSGFVFLGPDSLDEALPALGEQILTFYPIQEDSLGLRVTLGQWSLWASSEGDLRFAENTWSYALACGWRGCNLVERSGPAYVDGEGHPDRAAVQDVLAGGGFRCPPQRE